MGLDVLLQILRALERLATEVAFVRLQWDVYTDMRRDVVALDCRCAAVAPLTCQVQIVSALATDMALANMILDRR